MHPLRLCAAIACGCAASFMPLSLSAHDEAAGLTVMVKEQPAPLVEIAILLDTSGSMQGLIDQARTRIWGIVNELAKTTKNGQIPNLKIALYQYGNSGLDEQSNYIQKILDLTDDLDVVSEKLFALRTNGGEEYCGAVIGRAVADLNWSSSDSYRAIFIAGNEPFTQGGVNYKDTCKAAVSKGIVVNTLHCGEKAAAQSGEWIDGARLGDGECININHNQQQIAIQAPQDADIRELNDELNKTYIGYGAHGIERCRMQLMQDQAAPDATSFAQRAASKAGGNYKNSSWDLVDACKEEDFDLKSVKVDDLPEEMQAMSEQERVAFVAEKAAERAALQKKIAALSVERQKFVDEELKKMGADKDESLGAAVRKVMVEQLTERGYQVQKDK